jgi:hypothetical protein
VLFSLCLTPPTLDAVFLSLFVSLSPSDVEFGRIQARDLLQHLLTGPISNAPVDIVRVRYRQLPARFLPAC